MLCRTKYIWTVSMFTIFGGHFYFPGLIATTFWTGRVETQGHTGLNLKAFHFHFWKWWGVNLDGRIRRKKLPEFCNQSPHPYLSRNWCTNKFKNLKLWPQNSNSQKKNYFSNGDPLARDDCIATASDASFAIDSFLMQLAEPMQLVQLIPLIQQMHVDYPKSKTIFHVSILWILASLSTYWATSINADGLCFCVYRRIF